MDIEKWRYGDDLDTIAVSMACSLHGLGSLTDMKMCWAWARKHLSLEGPEADGVGRGGIDLPIDLTLMMLTYLTSPLKGRSLDFNQTAVGACALAMPKQLSRNGRFGHCLGILRYHFFPRMRHIPWKGIETRNKCTFQIEEEREAFPDEINRGKKLPAL